MFNQKFNIVGAIGPMKGICNIGSAFYGVLSKPMESGMVYRGFVEGFGSLYEAISEEGSKATAVVLSADSAINFAATAPLSKVWGLLNAQ